MQCKERSSIENKNLICIKGEAFNDVTPGRLPKLINKFSFLREGGGGHKFIFYETGLILMTLNNGGKLKITLRRKICIEIASLLIEKILF
jgi:hypothetical protein